MKKNQSAALSKLTVVSLACIIAIIVIFGDYLLGYNLQSIIPSPSVSEKITTSALENPSNSTVSSAAGNTTPRTSTTSSSLSGPATNSSTSSVYSTAFDPQGLQLQILQNATQIAYGTGIFASVELSNTLPVNLTLNVNYSSDGDIVAWDNLDFLCNISGVEDVFGFAVYSGHYTALNVSEAGSPLDLVPPVAISCPNSNYFQPYILQVEFSPSNDSGNFLLQNNSLVTPPNNFTDTMMMNITTEDCYNFTSPSIINQTVTTESSAFSCGPTNGLFGYWTPPASGFCYTPGIPNQTLSACKVNLLPIGSYTIVAEDLWNQTAFAYFQVVPT
jgi:hypothetical protein